jgi:hypothetical protein
MLNWDEGKLYYDSSNVGIYSIDWVSGNLQDSGATLSIDYGSRTLNDNLAGTTMLDYSGNDGIGNQIGVKLPLGITDTSNFLSIDPNSRILYGADGVSEAIDYSLTDGVEFNGNSTFFARIGSTTEAGYFNGTGGTVYFGDGTYAVNIDTGNLVLSSGYIVDNAVTPTTSIDPNNRQLYGSDGTSLMMDWHYGYLYGSGVEPSIDFRTKLLIDSTGTNTSVDWENRILYGADGLSEAIDYSLTDGVEFNGNSTFFARIGSTTEAGYFNGTGGTVYFGDGTYAINASGLSNLNGAVTIGGSYTLPTSDGSDGQVLTTDGAGNLTWTTSSGNVFDFAYLQPNTYNNPIQYLLATAGTGNVEFGTFTTPAPLNIDFGTL